MNGDGARRCVSEIDVSKPTSRMFTLAKDGTKIPFTGKGAKVEVARDVGVEIDFRFEGFAPVWLKIGARSRGDAARSPNLTLELHAGNWVTVVVGGRGPATSPAEKLIAPRETFVIEYGDTTTIKVECKDRDDALLAVDVRCQSNVRPTRGDFGRRLLLVAVPQAANLVSLWFTEFASFTAGP